ncbi:MAG TPA: helix-turn-helix domain-containing protein [Solirubrobacterales bacterium]
MQRTDFTTMNCSIARSMGVAGEPWTPLVIRDVYIGINRFDDLQRDLGISRKVLAERLRHLVDAGLLERRPYSERPPRDEYALTEMGQEFMDVLMAMVRWGDRWTAGDAGPPVLYRHHACGKIAHVEPVCSECGEPMHSTDVDVQPGPHAS